jgi:hypothetical protein
VNLLGYDLHIKLWDFHPFLIIVFQDDIMAKSARQKKLSEKELGSLYLLSEAPLIIDRVLQSGTMAEGDITAIHESLAKQAPDMALIGVALAGNLLATQMQNHENLNVLSTELKHMSINTVEEVGRIWIDACHYGVASDEDIHDMVHQTSDILCVFTSIFMDIAELCTPEPSLIRAIAGCLMYQTEAQADQASALVENKQFLQGQATPKINQSKTPALRDDIPLPPELQNKTYDNNVVTFTLFGQHS